MVGQLIVFLPCLKLEHTHICRNLISLNKRNTGRNHPEFNLRHDWNSLLDNQNCAPVTNRTTKRFPPADYLVEYLREFAKPQLKHINLNHTLLRIERRSDDGVLNSTTTITGSSGSNSSSRRRSSRRRSRNRNFQLTLQVQENPRVPKKVTCGVVILATGERELFDFVCPCEFCRFLHLTVSSLMLRSFVPARSLRCW